MHRDIILVETVGIGQAETDITRAADTCVLVLTPGMGDEIQVMKAGVMEIADILVINKADQDGAANLRLELQASLAMKCYLDSDWRPAIVLTEAVNSKGIDGLVEKVFTHKQFLISSGEIEKRRRERARLELADAIEGAIKSYVETGIEPGYLEEITDSLALREISPDAAARQIIDHSIKRVRPHGR